MRRFGFGFGVNRGGTISWSNYCSRQYYGYRIDDDNSSPAVTRIASDMRMHSELPIQKLMKGCCVADSGTVNYYLMPDDWTKKVDGTASNLDGTDGQVMVEIPKFYRKITNISATVTEVTHSLSPLSGYTEVPKMYIGAYEASVQRSTSKLCSVKNISADYRGGNNNAANDTNANSFLGVPASSISLINNRIYARNRGNGTKWNVTPWWLDMIVYELFISEYATRNSQAAVNGTLTSEGYRQGGLGSGVTTANATEWNNFNNYNPFILCGSSDILGNMTGEVSIVKTNFGGVGMNRTFNIPRYRGIENLFGHFWKWQDGANIYHEGAGGTSKLYTCHNPSNFADATEANYSYRGNLSSAEGWVKKMQYDIDAVMIPSVIGGNSSIYYCDYFYTPGLISQWRALLRGGSAGSGSAAGFSTLRASDSAAGASASLGARLCYIP